MAVPTTAQRAFFQRLSEQWGGADQFVDLPRTVAFKRTGDTEALGWRTHLPTDYLGCDRTLDIILTGSNSVNIPQLWIEPNPFLEWPHAETDGKLCLWPLGRSPIWLTQPDLADDMIHLLHRLTNMVQSGADPSLRDAEFAAEWTSYWWNANRPRVRAPGTVLLLDPPGERPVIHSAKTVSAAEFGGSVRGARSHVFIVAARKPDTVSRWIEHSRLPSPSQDSVKVAIVSLHSAPTAPGAPTSLAETEGFIEKWAAEPDAASGELRTLLADTSSMCRWLVFVHDGAALVGLRVVPRKAASKVRGRQNAKSRRHDEASLKRIGFDVDVAEVQRADPEWIQERGMNYLTRPLISSRVAVIGCGSLGSMVAESLALAGIGQLTLIDPGLLETANIGRHALGISAVGSMKAAAMRSRLLADYPHMTVTAFDKRVQSDDPALSASIDVADIVICTTADTECESDMMDRLSRGDIGSLMIAWSEPHALAGHSAHSPGDPYVLESLFAKGRSVDPATRFSESAIIPLPGCGESHVPGAGNRIRLIATVVVEHALDVLVSSGGVGEHRVWVAARATIDAHSGERLLLPQSDTSATVVRMIPKQDNPKDASLAI